jgi:putative endonuclease
MYGKSFFVYILTNKKNGVLYIGMTNSLIRRIQQHKSKEIEGFSKRYNLTKLVYYQIIDDVRSAITREKQMQAWKRQWKIELIEKENPEWKDLYDKILKS